MAYLGSVASPVVLSCAPIPSLRCPASPANDCYLQPSDRRVANLRSCSVRWSLLHSSLSAGLLSGANSVCVPGFRYLAFRKRALYLRELVLHSCHAYRMRSFSHLLLPRESGPPP